MNKQIEILGDDSIMLFGKAHKGKHLHQVPDDYLEWLQNELNKKKNQNKYMSNYEKALLVYCDDNF